MTLEQQHIIFKNLAAELTKIIQTKDPDERQRLLERLLAATIKTRQYLDKEYKDQQEGEACDRAMFEYLWARRNGKGKGVE